MVNELYGWQHSPQDSGKLLLWGLWDNPLLFSIRKASSNSASTPAHRPSFVNWFVMSDCSKWRRARGNKICQSLLQRPPWNSKGNEEWLKLESDGSLWKLIYTHIALESTKECVVLVTWELYSNNLNILFYIFFLQKFNKDP